METREREQERICFLSQDLVAALVVVSRHFFLDGGDVHIRDSILVAALVVVSRHLAATAAHRYLWPIVGTLSTSSTDKLDGRINDSTSALGFVVEF